MWLEGSDRYTLKEFGGSQSLVGESVPPPEIALLAQNVEFIPKGVRGRAGFNTFASPTLPARSLFYWKQGLSGSNPIWLLRFELGGGVVARLYSSFSVFTDFLLIASGSLTNCAYCHFIPWGKNLIILPVRDNHLGNFPAYIWDGNPLNAAVTMFRGPLQTTDVTLSYTQPATGFVSRGTHFAGVMAIDQFGHPTPPGPASGLVHVPLSLTATGNKTLVLTATPPGSWPSWISGLQFILTPAANPAEFFLVPGIQTPSGSSPVSVTFNLSDLTLRSEAEPAKDYFTYLAQTGGVHPILPKFGGQTGNRSYLIASYGNVDSLFISEANEPQGITPTRHRRQLPNGLPMNGAIPYGSGLLIWGDHYTFFLPSGGGEKPVLWPLEEPIHDSIGSPSPFGISVNRVLGYAIVASPLGLYRLEGNRYLDVPISYNQPDEWESIDWQYPYEVKVLEVPHLRTLMVHARLKTGGREIFCWDYTRGWSPNQLKFSRMNFQIPSFAPGHPAIWNHPTRSIPEVIIPSENIISTVAPVLRQLSVAAGDTDIRRGDNGSVAIDARYQTGKLPPGTKSNVQDVKGFRLGVSGEGTLTLNAVANEGLRTVALESATLAVAPPAPVLRTLDMREEQASLEFRCNVYGSWFWLDSLELFHDDWLEFR